MACPVAIEACSRQARRFAVGRHNTGMTTSQPPGAHHTIDPKVASLLPEIVRRIVEEVDPARIVLFGSHARGDATADSDVDLLIVTQGDAAQRETVLRVRRRLADLPIAKDVIVASEQRVREYGHLVGTILRPALREGITLHERR